MLRFGGRHALGLGDEVVDDERKTPPMPGSGRHVRGVRAELAIARPVPIAADQLHRVERLPITIATLTMTITRFAVFATDCVTAFVFLIVSVASSLYR